MTVYLVGAGPGDPGLITVKGLELLRTCDVVVYDRLAPGELLAETRAGCELIDVGKRPKASEITQEAINEILVDRAKIGLSVVRLKGGDPYVFGRGGEEAQALAHAGVDFEVVPGVTSAVGVLAYAGIPVTHRGISDTLTIVTGHEDSNVDWEAVAKVTGTIVILMGTTQREAISKSLQAGGVPQDTPCAIVEWGTTTRQRSQRCTLAELGQIPARPPAVIVVGQVSQLNLAWLERGPLAGKSVVVTRTKGRAGELTRLFGGLGARVLEIPTTQTEVLDVAPLEESEFEWVVFSSPTSVEVFYSTLAGSVVGSHYAVVGQATAQALASHGIAADLMPDSFSAQDLVAIFPHAQPTNPEPISSNRIFYPKSQIGRERIIKGLENKGWEVVSRDLYTTVPLKLDEQQLREVMGCDFITITASSNIESLGEIVSEIPGTLVCMGEQSAQDARRLGAKKVLVARHQSLNAIVEAVLSA